MAALLLAASSWAAPAQPKLGVLVVFDQLRAEDLQRYAPLFGEGGFGGLSRRGAAVLDARYANATTTTATGHATLSTGAGPQVHGIASNGWVKDSQYVYVAHQPGATFVDGEHPKGYGAVGPHHLQAPTLGDALKAATNGRGKVVSISLKDRAAIFTGGKSADLVLWYRKDKGVFSTSTAHKALPAWLKLPASTWPSSSMATGEWDPLPWPRLGLLQPKDDFEGEADVNGLGRAFPHHLKDITDDKTQRKAYPATPQAMNDVFKLAELAVDKMDLGGDVVPDLLIVNVSTTDYVGHWYGPQSLESVDVLRRADRRLRAFLAALDANVGRGHYVLALSSDHGAPPLPERAKAAGVDAGRILWDDVKPKLQDALASLPSLPAGEDGKPRSRLAALVAPHLYLHLDGLNDTQRQQALRDVRAVLEATPGIAAVYGDDVASDDSDGMARFYRRSRVPGRSGTFILRPRPYWVFTYGHHGKGGHGISHGSAYLYARTVPLFLLGPSIRKGRVAQPADVRDVAVTLAAMMGVPPPAAAEGRVLDVHQPTWRLLGR